MERLRIFAIAALLAFTSLPVSGMSNPEYLVKNKSEIPTVKINDWHTSLWWETTSRDLNRNNIVDWLEEVDEEERLELMLELRRLRAEAKAREAAGALAAA